MFAPNRLFPLVVAVGLLGCGARAGGIADTDGVSEDDDDPADDDDGASGSDDDDNTGPDDPTGGPDDDDDANPNGACDSTEALCEQVCIDPSDDPRYCGGCETQCDLGDVCVSGSCEVGPDCSMEPCVGFTYCDLATSKCLPGCWTDAQCGDNELCTLGSHACDCAEGHHRCGGKCVPDSSVAACGSQCDECRTDAGGDAACVGGQCVFTCDSGRVDCGEGQGCAECCDDSQCPDPAGGSASCTGGTCVEACDGGGQTVCGGTCTSTSSDPYNCGECDNSCPAPVGGSATCQGGACGETCPAGQSVCGGTCVDLTSDEDHCGACNNDCVTPTGGSVQCSGSECVQSCPAGLTPCDDACVDTDDDEENCGWCGHECDSSDVGEYECNWGECADDMTCYYSVCVAWVGDMSYPACCESGQHCCIAGGGAGSYCCD